MEHHVVTVKLDATVAGERVGVQEATVVLGVNAIPMIRLVCVPTRGKLTPLDPDVSTPDIRDFVSLYNDLQKKAEGLSDTNSSASITVQYEDSKSEMKVNGWVLAEVGLSSIGSISAPNLIAVIKHPICKLTKAGSIYQTPKSDISIDWNSILEGADDLLKITAKTYDFVANNDDYFWPTNSLAESYRTRLKDAEAKPDKYLAFNGSQGIFLGNVAGEMKDRIAEGIGRFVLPEEGGSSTWDMLIAASGMLLLSITQDEKHNFMTDQLVLEPTRPWKSPSVTLDDTMCSSLEAPCVDPFRISGVMCRKMGPYNQWPDLGLYNNGNPHEKEPRSEAFYAPVEAKDADGRVMKVQVPAILESAYRRDAPFGGDSIPDLGVEGIDQLIGDYDNALMAYCKAVYEIAATQLVFAKAHMVLDFSDWDDNLILPGNTCVFKVSGEPLFHGYIQNVVHHASIKGGCETMVSMSHVREGGSYEINGEVAIAEDSPNAAYE